jgi:hypothetical protein
MRRGRMDKRYKWLLTLKDGEPCDHYGCFNHVTHPCEVCGRIGGVRNRARTELQNFMDWIEWEINPTRARYGLEQISLDEQVRCYEILKAFHKKMDKQAHKEGKNG